MWSHHKTESGWPSKQHCSWWYYRMLLHGIRTVLILYTQWSLQLLLQSLTIVPVSRNCHNTVTSHKSGWQHETCYWCVSCPARIPQKYSAISVTTAIGIHSKYNVMVMKYICCDLPYVWCHLNLFSGWEEGCFHVTDAFVEFRCHVINTGFVHCNIVLQKLFYVVGILCPMQEGKFPSVVCDHLRDFCGT